MALLQRTRLLANERLDLPDYNNIENFTCADFKAIHKHVWTRNNFVISGFQASGVGTTQLTVIVANSVLVVGEGDGILFIGAPSLANLTTSSLVPSSTNFVEISINQDTGGSDSRAFWDKTANSGAGAEFSQIIDTFIFLKAEFSVNTLNFSGESNKVPICEVDVNSSGVITAIRDARNLFFRLGRFGNTTFDFPWGSRTEPPVNQFSGADKDISTEKQWKDAVMSRIRENSGTTFWFEDPGISLTGGFKNSSLNVLAASTNTARFSWSGLELNITDSSGTPSNSDVLANIRIFTDNVDLQLTRQDGIDAIPISSEEVLWVELPSPLANVTYSGVGLTASNYRINSIGSIPLNETTYWLAYRRGTKLYLRGLGELESGEERQISDETTSALAQFVGFDPETATAVPYTAVPNSSLFSNLFSVSDDLVTAISANTANINVIGDILDTNVYEEPMDIVSGAPANDNELTGPVSFGTNILLPLDSRDSDLQEEYVVGSGSLQVFLNGQFLCLDRDWEEVGTSGNPSDTIKILRDLVVGDKLTFRIDTLGGFNVNGGGGTGDVTGATNIGGGEGLVFKQKTGGVLELRTIKAGAGISIVTDIGANQIIISLTGGVPQPYFRTDITGQTTNLVGVGGTYNLGTNKLDVYRNGILMLNSTSVGLAIDRYQESTNNSVLIEQTPIASEVLSFVNQDTLPNYKNILTGLSGLVVTVPPYTLGDNSLKVYRNGILMNSSGIGGLADKYVESSPTTITLSQAAVISDVFTATSGPIPSFREDKTGIIGTVITLSNPYSLGSGELLVYRNGVLMLNSVVLASAVDRYQETSSVSITLEQAAIASDTFYFVSK